MDIQGTTRVYGLIGSPIAHTFSPLIHNTLAALLGENLVYVPFAAQAPDPELWGTDVRSIVEGAYRMGVAGLNATIPFKSLVIPFLREIDPVAEKIHAVNTLVRVPGGYKGYNTDLLGLRRALAGRGIAIRGRDVVVIGAGGAARAAAFLAGFDGAARLFILNRTSSRAQDLAADVRAAFPDMEVSVSLLSKAGQVEARDFLAIQCTKIGMHPDTEGNPIADDAFYEQLREAYDAVYNPTETAFIRRVRSLGREGYTGLDMLVGQALEAFTLWTGKDVGEREEKAVTDALRDFLGIGEAVPASLVLTGFMGSGKTTVGRILEQRFGMRFLDTDAMIEERAGCSVSEIFEAEGEQGFRDRETALLEEAAAHPQDGCVYSTGGGIVLREKNRELLKKLGHVVLLEVAPETVLARLAGDTSRPLLAGSDREKKVRTLLESRSGAYASAASLRIDTGALAAEEIAERLFRVLSGGKNEACGVPKKP